MTNDERLIAACKSGALDEMERLCAPRQLFIFNLGPMSSLSVKGDNGDSLAHIAVRYPKKEVIKYLIKKGVDLNVRNAIGRSPLHVATERGEISIVELLVDSGASVDVEDSLGETPLWKTLHQSDKEIMKFLIARGADVNHKNKNGVTPIERARDNAANSGSDTWSRASQEAIEILAESGAVLPKSLPITNCKQSECGASELPHVANSETCARFEESRVVSDLATWIERVVKTPESTVEAEVPVKELTCVCSRLFTAARQNGNLNAIGGTFKMRASGRCSCGATMNGEYLAFLSTTTRAILLSPSEQLQALTRGKCPYCARETWKIRWG